MKIWLKNIESNAMTLVTARIAVSSGLAPRHPYNKSAATIVRDINLEHGSDISRKIATMMVLKGIIEESPKTRVTNKNIPSQVWNLIRAHLFHFWG